MLIDFPNFERYLIEHDKESILRKGKKFSGEGLIKHIHAFSGTEWDIYLESERENVPGYTVRIKISNGRVTHMNCNCFGFRFGPLCKHIVGSLYAIREKKLYDESIGDYQVEEEEEEEEELVKEKETEGEKMVDETEEKEEEPKKKKVVKKGGKGARTPLESEFSCLLCRDLIKEPVTLPCESHSACLSCLEELLEKTKEDADGFKTLGCPKCGGKGGVTRVKDKEDLKVNKELERVQHAYEKERNKWMKEKEKLEQELSQFKDEAHGRKGKGDKISEEIERKQDKYEADVEKLKEQAENTFYGLKTDEKEYEGPRKGVEEIKKEQEEEKVISHKDENRADIEEFEPKVTKKTKRDPLQKGAESKSTSKGRKKSQSKEKENVHHHHGASGGTGRYNLRDTTGGYNLRDSAKKAIH